MADDTFFVLDFHPLNGPVPSPRDLEWEIFECPVATQPFHVWTSGQPVSEVVSEALRYSIHPRGETVDISMAGDTLEVLTLALHLLQPLERSASLSADSRPILSQLGGQLRLDLQRFWTPELLQWMRSKRDFVRVRVLYDFPEDGFNE